MHLSLLALYGVGGWLVRQGLMPVRVLLSAIGFTFSLVFATQGVVQTLADARRVSASMRRYFVAVQGAQAVDGPHRCPEILHVCCSCNPEGLAACSVPKSPTLVA